MIYYFTPYSTEKNLGKAYNHYCSIVPNDEDWICLMDGDIAFFTPNWGHIIEQYTKKTDKDLLTCYATRTRNTNQKFLRELQSDRDIVRTYEKIEKHTIYHQHKLPVKDVYSDIAGFLMLFKKSLWKQVPFPEDKILGIDTHWSFEVLRQKFKIGVMEGLVVFHYYRHHKEVSDTSHLK